MARVGTASKNTWSFLPTAIPTCSLWLDAADLSTLFSNTAGTVPVASTATGTTVLHWKDKSINASFASNSTGPTLQSETATALTSLNFNGSQFLAMANGGAQMPTGTSDATYFAVCRSVTGVGSQPNIFSHGSNTGLTAGQARYIYANATSAGITNCASTANTASINTVVNCVITGGIKDYVLFGSFNGALLAGQGTNSQGTTFVTSGGTGNQLAYVGGTVGGAANYTGNICEIIVYNRALDNYERQQVEGYLAWKWAIPAVLPELTHPYYSPLSSGFTPMSIISSSACRLWLDASKLSGSNGSAVNTWTDSAAFGTTTNTAINVGSTAPTLATTLASGSLNGLNTVAFNGSQYMNLSAPGNSTTGLVANLNPITMFVVAQSRNASPTTRQCIFTQGPGAYPTSLNSTRIVVESYFNTSNKFSFDNLGVTAGSIPVSNGVYYNNYTIGEFNIVNNSGAFVGWETGNSFTTQGSNASVIIGNARARIGASRKLSNMSATATTAPTTITITSSGGPPCQNQIISFSGPGNGVTSDVFYYIRNVTGTGPSYNITVSTTNGGTELPVTSGGLSGAVQAYTTINATSASADTVSIVSSTLPTVGQAIIFAGSVGGLIADTTYYILNVNSTTAPLYVVQLSLIPGGGVFDITSTTSTISNTTSASAIIEQSTDSYFTGNIAEMIYYNVTLSTTQRQRVEGYLAWKWGLQAQLPATHPFALANYFYNSTRPSSRMFRPPDIEGCQLWIDPADPRAMGFAVDTWSDKSGGANHATQLEANLRPFYVPAQKGVYFGAGEFLGFSGAGLGLFQNIGYASMFVVIRVPPGTPPPAQGVFFAALDNAAGTRFAPAIFASSTLFATFGAIAQRLDGGTPVTPTSGAAYPYGGISIVNVAVNYSTSPGGTALISLNGTQLFSAGISMPSGFGTTNNTASSAITLGVPAGSTRQSNFYVHEILLYTSAGTELTSTNLNDINGYLAWKWGIQNSLPSANPYSPFNASPATPPIAPVAGSKLWLDGAAAGNISTGSAVAMMADKSGLDNAAVNGASTLTLATYTKPEGTTQPVLLGPNPGTSNSLTTRTIARDTSNHSYAFVVKYPASGTAPTTVVSFGTETFGHSGTTAPQLENNNAIPAGGNTYALYGSFASADAFYGGNTFVCVCVRQNGAWTFTTNGQSYTTVAPNALKNLASGQYTVGVNSASGVQLGDVVVYNYALTAAERQQLEGYLMWKWGVQRSGNSQIPFPTTHPFRNFQPAVTLPSVNAMQLYKKTFDVSDLSPAIWLDANDPNTYVLDANNRVQWITNKGLGGLKATFNLTSASGNPIFQVNNNNVLTPGQAFEIAAAGATITGISTIISTPSAPIFFYVLSFTLGAPSTITISSTFGGAALTGAGAGTSACYVSQRFTKPVGTSSGVGLNGPLLTQSAVGTGTGLNYLDFSSGGTFRITGASTDSAGTSVVLTLNATHGIPANRQVRVVVSGGTYSTNGASATGITSTYIVSAQTGTTITIPYNSSQSSATINNVVGYVEYGSIILSAISMTSGTSTANFTTSFDHGLATSNSVFLSLAGVTIAGVSVPLNLANGVYSVTVLTSTTFNVDLLNLGGSAITSTPGVSVTSLISTTSPSYAYFPYNGYCLESMSATGMLTNGANIFVVTHTNPGASGLAASSIARCGRNVETQPPIFAVAQTVNAASGMDLNGIANPAVGGIGRDFNVRLANYNAVGNQAATSTTPSIRLGIERNSLSTTSVALTDTNRSVTNTTNGFRVMSAFVNLSSSGTSTELGQYSNAVASCGWKPTNFNSLATSPGAAGTLAGTSFLGNTTYANNTLLSVVNIYQIISDGTTATATFVPYGIEPTYNPLYVGQTVFIQASFTGGGSAITSGNRTITAVTPTTFSFNPSGQTTTGLITGQASAYFQVFSGSTFVSPHIRIGADTNATTGYSSLAGYLTDRFFDGGIAEIIVIGGLSFSPENRMLVEGYLAQKYNFQDNLGSPGVIIPPQSVANTPLSNVSASGTTVTITFGNTVSPSVNPFVVGSQIVVAGTIVPNYTGTYVVTGISGTNQVSYSVASTSGTATSLSGVTVSSSGNLITNLTSFNVTAATSSGSTATVTFTNPLSPNVNPFVPGAQIVVSGITPSGYSGTFVIVSTTGANQVSYSTVGSNLGTATLTNATVSSTRTQTNQFIHPYSAGPANIASNLALSGTFTQNLALWYDAANYSSLTLNGTAVLTWSSRLGNVAYATNVMAPVNSLFPLKYVANSQNGLPGLEVMSTVALTGVTLTTTTATGSTLTVTSGTPVVQYQLIILATATSGLVANRYYIVSSIPTFTSPNIYTFQVADTISTLASPIGVSQNSGLTIACQLFTGGSMVSASISAVNTNTTGTNTEFTYFYIFKWNRSESPSSSGPATFVGLRSGGNARYTLGPNLFSVNDSLALFTTDINYSTRGGFLTNTPIILSVYKRGRDMYSRMIGGGKTSQFVQTFSRDNQTLRTDSFQLFINMFSTASSFSFNGTLYEMMFFRDALTDQAIQQTEGYLAQKWGLTGSLPQTHAYYSATA